MIRGQVWLPKATIVADTATVRVFLECFTTQNGIIHSYLGKVSQDTDDLVEAMYWFLLATHQLQLDKIYKDCVGARKGWIYAASSPATSAARNDKGWKLQEDLHSHMCNEPWCPSGIAADKVSCTWILKLGMTQAAGSPQFVTCTLPLAIELRLCQSYFGAGGVIGTGQTYVSRGNARVRVFSDRWVPGVFG